MRIVKPNTRFSKKKIMSLFSFFIFKALQRTRINGLCSENSITSTIIFGIIIDFKNLNRNSHYVMIFTSRAPSKQAVRGLGGRHQAFKNPLSFSKEIKLLKINYFQNLCLKEAKRIDIFTDLQNTCT